MVSSRVKEYYQLTKPGIIYGNILTAAAGVCIALKHPFDFKQLIFILVSTSLVIGSACVFNNIIDRNIDSKMKRTKKRALVEGTITLKNALIFGSTLGFIGFIVLLFEINILTFIIGLIAFIDYVVLYGYAKRHSIYGTLVGTIAGSASIVAGYTAATNQFNLCALLLFAIMTFWQMPHFYAIAIYRKRDYEMANIPLMPIIKGIKRTKIEIIFYTLCFFASIISLWAYGYADNFFLFFTGTISLYWLLYGLLGNRNNDVVVWAKKMFRLSLLVLLLMCAMIFIRLGY